MSHPIESGLQTVNSLRRQISVRLQFSYLSRESFNAIIRYPNILPASFQCGTSFGSFHPISNNAVKLTGNKRKALLNPAAHQISFQDTAKIKGRLTGLFFGLINI